MKTDTSFRRFMGLEKIKHLTECKNRSLVYLYGHGQYCHITKIGDATYQVIQFGDSGREITNIFSIGVVYDVIKGIQSDMRKWRKS